MLLKYQALTNFENYRQYMANLLLIEYAFKEKEKNKKKKNS